MEKKVKRREVSLDEACYTLSQQQPEEAADITKDVFRKMDEASEPLEK